MNRHLYTIKWTQPYSTEWQRPYLRGLQLELEATIERYLESTNNYPDAQQVLERIQSL